MENIRTLETMLIPFSAALLIFYFRYKFPHFNMHFNGMNHFTINDFDFNKKCKFHSKEDIEKFKKRQFIFCKVIIAILIIDVISVIVAILLR